MYTEKSVLCSFLPSQIFHTNYLSCKKWKHKVNTQAVPKEMGTDYEELDGNTVKTIGPYLMSLYI